VPDVEPFGVLLAIVAVAGLAAVLSSRLSERLRVPAPALFLAAAAIAVRYVPALHAPPERTVQRLVTISLVLILFDGGLHLGWSRLRVAAGAIVGVGVVGTFLTAAAVAVLAHLSFGLTWYLSVLLGTAVAPTDPAVVFSVLGRREVSGRSGTLLEGESGANDPVGIALMASLITAGGLTGGAAAHVVGEFALQMSVGAAVGLVGGYALIWTMRHLPLPGEGLYPLRTLASALLLYGAATAGHGSGFLAVFVAGIAVGDARAPYKREIERFHSALSSLAEIVAFVVLGLTIDLGQVARLDAWLPGLVLSVVLTVVIRPVLVGLCLAPTTLGRNERGFVLFAGLKGAVPILLGSFLLGAHIAHAQRLYAIIVVVVVFSVVVQGGLVPTIAQRLGIPMRTIEPEPWALGVRLRDEPQGVQRFTVVAGAPADRQRVADISELTGDVWLSLVVRDGELVSVRGETQLQAGDEILALADPDQQESLRAAFCVPRRSDGG
jgi:cell volume regulation protein A